MSMSLIQLPQINLEEPRCAPIMRQSFSAPASLLLESVLKKAHSLHEQLDRLSDGVKKRGGSMVDITEHSDTPVTSKGAEDTMVCHGCHGVIGSGAHLGSATGMNLCSLKHSSSCPGGYVDDHSWKACPPGYTPGMVMSETGFERTMDTVDFNPGNLFVASTPAVQSSEDDLRRFYRQAQREGARERRPGIVYTGT